MFRIFKPDERALQHLQARYRELPLSDAEVGCTRGGGAAGHKVDNYRVQVGSGSVVFERATQALRDWRMLRLGWVEPCWPNEPIKEGSLVGTLARVMGLWAVNVARIVYVIDEDGAVARFGFAYGTLPGHVEKGEERFLVEWDHADDSVWFDIRAISRPGSWLTWLSYPMARRLQRRFGRDSLRAMVEAVR
jgi:uncharacterized protein (UPF0548 family)